MDREKKLNIWVFGGLLVAAFACLFPVLWIPQDLWDGVIISYAYDTLNPRIYDTWFDETGWPLVAEMYKWIHGIAQSLDIHSKIGINIVIFFSVFLASFEIYRLSTGLLGFSARVGLCSALLFLVCPGWNMLVSSVFLMHAVFIYLCLLGARLYLLSPNKGVRALGFVFTVLSFQHAANPAITFPLIAYYVLFYSLPGKSRRVELLIAGAGLLIAFFGFRYVFPAHALYDGYNAIEVGNFLKPHLYELTWKYYAEMYYPALILSALLCVYAVKQDKHINAFQIIFLLLFVFVSTVPYMAVAKVPYSHLGWSSRFTLNTTIPVVFLFGFFLNSVRYPKSGKWVALPFLLSAPVLTWSSYHLLEGYGGKVRQLMHQAYFVEGFKVHNKPRKGYVEFEGWSQSLTRYENNYYLYQAYGTADWDAQLDKVIFDGESMADYPRYKDKYVFSSYADRCSSKAIILENISTAGRRELLRFFINKDDFMQENKRLYFKVKAVKEISCKY